MKIGRGVLPFELDLIYGCRGSVVTLSLHQTYLFGNIDLAFDLLKYLSALIFVYPDILLYQVIGTFFIFVVTVDLPSEEEGVFKYMLVPFCNVDDLLMVL